MSERVSLFADHSNVKTVVDLDTAQVDGIRSWLENFRQKIASPTLWYVMVMG